VYLKDEKIELVPIKIKTPLFIKRILKNNKNDDYKNNK